MRRKTAYGIGLADILTTPRSIFIPPHDVVERVIGSSKAARGEDVQVEHPVRSGNSPAFDFYSTLAGRRGSTLIRDQVVPDSPGLGGKITTH